MKSATTAFHQLVYQIGLEQMTEMLRNLTKDAAPTRRRKSSNGSAMLPTRAHTLGAKIRAERKARGLTQVQLAKLIGIAQHQVSRLERGGRLLDEAPVQKWLASVS